MEVLTDLVRDRTGEFRIGHEAGQFYTLHAGLPPIPVSSNAAVLCHLSNEQIRKYGASVPCRERLSPYDDGDPCVCPRCGFRQPESNVNITLAIRAGYLVVFECLRCHGSIQRSG